VDGGPRGRTVVTASLGRRGQLAIAHYALLTGGPLENCESAKVKELGEPKSCFSLSFVAPLGAKLLQEAHRSARHIDAERTAAVVNAPKEVKRKAGKRACSPVKEL
jgi:hypothetical protein